MSAPRILIAGIGNIFLGDDAFGVEVVRRLVQRPWPAHVQVTDFGIRGFDLAFALVNGCEAVILIDALPRSGPPGTLYVLEPDLTDSGQQAVIEFPTHNLDPVKVLHLARAYGQLPGRVLVVGCEPASLGDEAEGEMGLSQPVQAALDDAIQLVEMLVAQIEAEPEALNAVRSPAIPISEK